MRAWKADYDAKLRSTVESTTSAADDAPARAVGNPEQQRSKVLDELELARQEKA